MSNSYLIQSLDNPAHFWHTQKGWTTRANAHTFDEEIRESSMHEGGFVLPEQGCWMRLTQEVKPNSFWSDHIAAQPKTYIIESVEKPVRYFAVWPNKWTTDREMAATYNEEQRNSYELPSGGCWALVSQPEPTCSECFLSKSDPIHTNAGFTFQHTFQPTPESISGATALLPCPFCGVVPPAGVPLNNVVHNRPCYVIALSGTAAEIEGWNRRAANPAHASVSGATERLTNAEFAARGLARSRYHDKLFLEGRPRPTNEQFDEGWNAARKAYLPVIKQLIEAGKKALTCASLNSDVRRLVESAIASAQPYLNVKSGEMK